MKNFLKTLKPFVAGVLATATVLTGIYVFAGEETVQVWFNHIKLVVDGQPAQKDTILYEGRTYVQLRETAEILGMEVEWNEKTTTAYIDQPGTGRKFNEDGSTYTSEPAFTSTPAPDANPTAVPGAKPYETVDPTNPFKETSFFSRISPQEAQTLFNNNKRFVLYYYNSLSDASKTAIDWAVEGAQEYGYVVYGVDREHSSWNTNDVLTFVNSRINTIGNADVPTLFLVNGQGDVRVIRVPASKVTVLEAMNKFYTETKDSAPVAAATASPAPSTTVSSNKIAGDNVVQLSVADAKTKYDNGNSFTLIAYNSSTDSSSVEVINKAIANNKGKTVYVIDFKDASNSYSWWGYDLVTGAGKIFDLPTVILIRNGAYENSFVRPNSDNQGALDYAISNY